MASKATPPAKNITRSRANGGISTGPRTAAGKQRSSQNALVHGATSPRLLDDQEREAYQRLLQALRQQYPSSNPLVQMQLERISRLKVQLERIQNVIDASFVAERLLAAAPDYAAQRGRLTEKSNELLDWQLAKTFAKLSANFGSWLDNYKGELLTVAAELRTLEDVDRLQTHADFLRYLPAFCKYVIEQAIADETSTADAVAEIRQSPYAIPSSIIEPWLRALRASLQRSEPRSTYTDARKAPYSGPAQRITDVSVDDLKICAVRLQEQMMGFLKRVNEMQELESRVKLSQDAAIPDPEKLDRLMRYQTTINRQLSSAMGELLELVRLR